MPEKNTRHPSWHNRSMQARPIPEEPPVTIAVLPSKRAFIFASPLQSSKAGHKTAVVDHERLLRSIVSWSFSVETLRHYNSHVNAASEESEE
jgi:hypothetical protein